MAKKQEQELSMDALVGELMKGTNFEISKDSNVLSQRIKVETPLIAVNCILGGGTPLGSVCESFGGPRSGKSTWLYITMAKFLRTYSNGIAMILDNESSADDSRLEHFGVDTKRVLRLPSSSIESGFLNLLQVLENKSKSEQAKQVPVFVVWDSISKGLAQDGSTQSRMNAQDRARVIKNYMSEVLPQIEKHPFILNLINQVVYETDRYGNRKVKSGGGVGLEHDVHFKVRTDLGGDEWDGSLLVGRYSTMHIVKSKFSPEFSNIPIYIDVTDGGRIDEVRSFVDYCVGLSILDGNTKKGYYIIDNPLMSKYQHRPECPTLFPLYKSLRYAKLVEIIKSDESIVELLKVFLMEYLGSIYHLQQKVMEDYLEECRAKYKAMAPRFEYEIYSNEDVKREVIETITTDTELLSKVQSHLESESPNSMCVQCGSLMEYHEPCKACKVDKTLSKDTLRYLTYEIESAISDVAYDSSVANNEDITEE